MESKQAQGLESKQGIPPALIGDCAHSGANRRTGLAGSNKPSSYDTKPCPVSHGTSADFSQSTREKQVTELPSKRQTGIHQVSVRGEVITCQRTASSPLMIIERRPLPAHLKPAHLHKSRCALSAEIAWWSQLQPAPQQIKNRRLVGPAGAGPNQLPSHLLWSRTHDLCHGLKPHPAVNHKYGQPHRY